MPGQRNPSLPKLRRADRIPSSLGTHKCPSPPAAGVLFSDPTLSIQSLGQLFLEPLQINPTTRRPRTMTTPHRILPAYCWTAVGETSALGSPVLSGKFSAHVGQVAADVGKAHHVDTNQRHPIGRKSPAGCIWRAFHRRLLSYTTKTRIDSVTKRKMGRQAGLPIHV